MKYESDFDWVQSGMSEEFREKKLTGEIFLQKIVGKDNSSFDISGKESMELVRQINEENKKNNLGKETK